MGDLVLKESAAAWQQALDGRGFLARYGGEEFTVLLPNTLTDLAEVILNELRASVSRGQTCSIGLTVWDGLEDPDQVVTRADEALYHAKRTGRNRLAVHDGTGVRACVDTGAVDTGAVDTGADLAQPKVGEPVEMGTGVLRDPSTTARPPSGAVSSTRTSLAP